MNLSQVEVNKKIKCFLLMISFEKLEGHEAKLLVHTIVLSCNLTLTQTLTSIVNICNETVCINNYAPGRKLSWK